MVKIEAVGLNGIARAKRAFSGWIMRLVLIVASLLTFAFFGAASAGERFALIVANSSFTGGPSSPRAALSSRLVADTLGRAGFDISFVGDADTAKLADAMRSFQARLAADPGNVGVFYYVGYAKGYDGANYMLPLDPEPIRDRDLPTRAISLNAFLDFIAASPATKLVFLDALWVPPENQAAAGPMSFALPAETAVAYTNGATRDDKDVSLLATTLAAALAKPEATVQQVLRDTAIGAAMTARGRPQPSILSNISQAAVITGHAEVQISGSDNSGSDEFLPVPAPIDTPPAIAGAEPEPAYAPPADGGMALPSAPSPSDDSNNVVGGYMPGSEPETVPKGSIPMGNLGQNYGEYAGSPPPEDQTLGSMPPPADQSIGSMPPTDGENAPSPATELAAVQDPSDEDAWAAVRAGGDPAAVKAFLLAYPQSAHAPEAMALFVALLSGKAPAGAAPDSKPVAAEPAYQPPPVETAQMPQAQPPAPGSDGEQIASAPPAAESEAPAAEQEVIRHPTIDTPDVVVAAETFTVSVALTEEKLTPEVKAKAAPTTTLTPEGAFAFSMPTSAEEWPIDIDLLAAGFDLVDGGKWSRRVMLYKVGDSDFARFDIKARAITEDSKPRKVMARFYHEGRFLGSASRLVTVTRVAAPAQFTEASDETVLNLASASEVELPTQDLKVNSGSPDDLLNVPDLDVTVHYDDPDNLGRGLIVIHSPHIAGPVSAEFDTPAGMTDWLNGEYARLVSLGLKVRGAVSLAEPAAIDATSQQGFNEKAAEGFGDDLYRNYVPQAFKDVFWSLKLRGLIHSIQITSNSPVLPWELVRPTQAPGAQSDGFLGISYRLARWAPRAAPEQVDQPLDHMRYTGVVAVAPAYQLNQELPFQQTEISALSKLAGFRLVAGDFNAFQQMIGEVSTGFIHFSGHGEVNDNGNGVPVFAIRLADQLLDPTTWRALTFAPHDHDNPFYFFNACDTGRAASLGGFVQGWGPAVLASGASGFIGGMWPLTDRTAASFSTEFYGTVDRELATGPVYLADVLKQVRQRFYETGDPTYLAYTFYGNANLQVVADARPSVRVVH